MGFELNRVTFFNEKLFFSDKMINIGSLIRKTT